ncbi:hypothetical protein CF319_g8513 [Tilletia indica]|nr:hypothetical protein CF319_g8513 [Tilletia indica]
MVSAVGAWHKTYGVPWCFVPGSSLSLALRGAVAMTPASSKRPPREPYTPAYLRSLRPHFDLSDPKDRAIWACALCAFWGLARIGEVTVPTQRTFDPVVHVCRAGWSLRPSSPDVPPAGVLRLPWTKTTRYEGAVVVLAAQDADLCPVAAMSTHLSASPMSTTAPLFAYSHKGKTVPLSRSVFLTRLRRAAEASALPPLHGHSFRIGGCTELLLRGKAIDDVKAHGRWKSDAWTTYVRDHAGVFSARLASVSSVAALVSPA